MPTPPNEQALIDAVDTARAQHDIDKGALDAIVTELAKENASLATAQATESASHDTFRAAVKALTDELNAEAA